MPNLLLLERPEHLKLPQVGEVIRKMKPQICPLTPAALHHCIVEGLPFVSADSDFFLRDEFDRTKALSDELIENILLDQDARHKSGGESVVSVSRCCRVTTYHYLNALHYQAFLLNRICNWLEDGSLIMLRHGSETHCQPVFPVSEYRDSLSDLILKSEFCDRVVLIPLQAEPVVPLGWKQRLKKIIRPFYWQLRALYESVRINLLVRTSKFLPGSRKLLLMVSGKYAWASLFEKEDFKRSYIPVAISLPHVWPQPVNSKVENPSTSLLLSHTFCGFRVGVLCAWLQEKIDVFAVYKESRYLCNRLNLKKFDCVIFSVVTTPYELLVLEWARLAGVTRICYQHGEKLLYPDDFWVVNSELVATDHYFSFGDGVTSGASKIAEEHDLDVSFVSIGSAAIDEINLRNEKTKTLDQVSNPKKIVFASSKFFAHSWFGYPADEAHLRARLAIFSALEEVAKLVPSAEIFWKANPAPEYLEFELTSDVVTKVEGERRFTDLIDGSACIILDRPSTTTVEVAATNVPLFVLMLNDYWYEEPLKLLAKRAVICRSKIQ